ncbi:MAG: hypothetical protein KA383_14670 [Phycisphaerae bacterium]|nr:hypothetical protein [Phycisphaerae bacterium]
MSRFIHRLPIVWATILSLQFPPLCAAAGHDAYMRFGPPTNVFPAVVTADIHILNPDGTWGTIPVPPIIVPPGIPAEVKRDLVMAALESVTDPRIGAITPLVPAGLQVHLETIRPIRVRFNPGATGESPDYVLCKAIDLGVVAYNGFFDPLDYAQQPAIFTAGIITDVGELTAQVSATELNLQTDGPIICQALFQRLAPHAPQYGAQINYAGDRLEIYFDPAYSVQTGGVIFGTTSPGQGAAAEVAPRVRFITGDVNCDGEVSFRDINVFILALTNPAAYAAAYPDCDPLTADINGDGVVDFRDINPFVQLLAGGG